MRGASLECRQRGESRIGRVGQAEDREDDPNRPDDRESCGLLRGLQGGGEDDDVIVVGVVLEHADPRRIGRARIRERDEPGQGA